MTECSFNALAFLFSYFQHLHNKSLSNDMMSRICIFILTIIYKNLICPLITFITAAIDCLVLFSIGLYHHLRSDRHRATSLMSLLCKRRKKCFNLFVILNTLKSKIVVLRVPGEEKYTKWPL